VKRVSRRVDAPRADAPVTTLELFFDIVVVFVVTRPVGLVAGIASSVTTVFGEGEKRGVDLGGQSDQFQLSPITGEDRYPFIH
jgi:hypothetical protein